MLSKCANPGCPAPFLYLNRGKLFRFDTVPELPARQTTEKAVRQVEFFWLCEDCAGTLTLSYKQGIGITTVSLLETKVRAMSAS